MSAALWHEERGGGYNPFLSIYLLFLLLQTFLPHLFSPLTTFWPQVSLDCVCVRGGHVDARKRRMTTTSLVCACRLEFFFFFFFYSFFYIFLACLGCCWICRLVWDRQIFFPPPNSNANLQANSFSETFPKEKCFFLKKYFIICLPALPAASAAGDIRWIAEIEWEKKGKKTWKKENDGKIRNDHCRSLVECILYLPNVERKVVVCLIARAECNYMYPLANGLYRRRGFLYLLRLFVCVCLSFFLSFYYILHPFWVCFLACGLDLRSSPLFNTQHFLRFLVRTRRR